MGSGTFVSLCPVPAIALGPMNDIGRRTGMLMTILALGALAGPPISGAINDAGGNFVNVGIYAGQCLGTPSCVEGDGLTPPRRRRELRHGSCTDYAVRPVPRAGRMEREVLGVNMVVYRYVHILQRARSLHTCPFQSPARGGIVSDSGGRSANFGSGTPG